MSLREAGRARREEHLASLFGLARDVAGSKDLDAMLDHVAHATLQITGAERAFILLLDGDQLTFGVGRDREQALTAHTFKQLSHSVCQKVLESQEQVCVFDAATDSEFGLRRSVVNLQLQGIVAVPLFGRSGLTGVLYIDSKTKALAALRKEMTVLTAIASVASLMIDNTRLFHRATVDAATGLFSRSLLMIRLEEEVSRSRRYKRPFSLVMVDLDARDGGDPQEAIKRVAQIVRLQLRAGIDFPSLYSDDRVAMILPETDVDGAMVVAERIREKVAGPDAAQTVSIGIAAFPAAAPSMHGLIDAAERALTSARQQGRNRTIVGVAT
jgi:diguanylate cyclase (GGDEF)-like protein